VSRSASLGATLGWLVASCTAPPSTEGEAPTSPVTEFMAKRAMLEALGPELEAIGRAHGLPGFVAYAFEGDAPTFFVASGVRRQDRDDPVLHSDRFHLGSCTKAMTAVLAARLVDREVITWDHALRLAFDRVHPELADVTLADLLQHRAGLVEDLTRTPHWKTLWASSGTPRDVRDRVASRLVREAPETPPRTRTRYANASYLVAGAVLERATDTPWSELMTSQIFEPLGMRTCGFGPPAAGHEAPWGHRVTPQGPKPVPPGPQADNPPALGPAGTVHCSVEDWGRFVMAFVAIYRGESGFVSAESMERLVEEPAAGGDHVMGWLKLRRPWAEGPVFYHDGSNTMFYAAVWAAPSADRALLVATNRGDAFAATDAMFARMVDALFRSQ